MTHRTLLFFLIGSALLACARSPRPLVSPVTRVPERQVGRSWSPVHRAWQAGLDSLRSSRLPEGTREIRIQLDHSFVIRLLDRVGGPARGEAFLVQGHYDLRDVDPRDLRRYQDVDSSARWERKQLRCGAPMMDADSQTTACRIGMKVNWGWILARFDSSPARRMIADTGVSPRPLPWLSPYPGVDPVTGLITTGGSGCSDQGAHAMRVEVLEGDRYRSGAFWCLENPGESGTAHHGLALLYDRLRECFDVLWWGLPAGEIPGKQACRG